MLRIPNKGMLPNALWATQCIGYSQHPNQKPRSSRHRKLSRTEISPKAGTLHTVPHRLPINPQQKVDIESSKHFFSSPSKPKSSFTLFYQKMHGTTTRCASPLRVQKRRQSTRRKLSKNTLKILPYLTSSTLLTILPPKIPLPTTTTTSPPIPSARFFSSLTIHRLTHLTPSPHPLQKKLRPTLLQNPIHPIFSPKNFPTISKHHYALLLPALKLASRFLTSPPLFSWWVKLILAEMMPHPHIPGARVLCDIEDNMENRVRAYMKLRDHAQDVEFRFRDEVAGFGSTHAIFNDPPTTATSSRGGGGKKKKKRENIKWVVYLDTRFETYISADSLSLSLSHSQRSSSSSSSSSNQIQQQQHQQNHNHNQNLRFHLLTALNLVHETAHTLSPSSSSTGQEPYYSPHDPVNELGASWETHTFGGKIQPVGFDVPCKDGLMWFPWLGREEELVWMREGRGRFWGVKMEWVKGLFGEEGWRDKEMMGMGDVRGGMGGGGLGVRVWGEGVREPFVEGGWIQR